MALFSQRSAAFCWNTRGECFGVLMDREGQNYRLLDSWSGKASGQQTISMVLMEGFNRLNVNENDFVLNQDI